MTVREWWLVYDAKRPPEEQEAPTYHDLYQLIWTGEDTKSTRMH